MAGDIVTVYLKATLSDDKRKILHEVMIINHDGQMALHLESNGTFLDLENRRLIFATDTVIQKCGQYLSDVFDGGQTRCQRDSETPLWSVGMLMAPESEPSKRSCGA